MQIRVNLKKKNLFIMRVAFSVITLIHKNTAVLWVLCGVKAKRLKKIREMNATSNKKK